MDQDASEIRREIEETRARMGDTVEALGYKADVPSRVKDAVNDRVETVRGAIGDAFGTVKETVAGASGKVGDAAGTMREKLPSTDGLTDAARRGAGMAVENPLGLALGALAVGFLAGLAAPVSDLERRTVGPLRDDLVDKAWNAGSDAIEQGKQALQDKAKAVLAAAQRPNGTT
jgi:hypothetical protein